MQEDDYKVFRNSEGRVDAINRTVDGATVPTWDRRDLITIQFQDWLANHSDFDIKDHSPPAPQSIALPDWSQFRVRLSTHSAVARISTNPRNTFFYPQLVAAMWQMGSNPDVLVDIAMLWGGMLANAPLLPNEANELAVIALECKMPFRLDDHGAIVPIGE